MPEYDRFDVSEVIDVNKTDVSHECIISHYWYFLMINLKFQPELCNGCHDLTQKAMSFNDVAIITVKGNSFLFCVYE